MTYQELIRTRLAKSQKGIEARKKAYWNLRNAGFSNIDAEAFLGARRFWFD